MLPYKGGLDQERPGRRQGEMVGILYGKRMWNITDWQNVVFSVNTGSFWLIKLTAYRFKGSLVKDAFQLSENENRDFIQLDKKLSIVRNIINCFGNLELAYCGLPDAVYLKGALEITKDLEE
ncbi:hypothetical protein TNCV_1031721 [Trichonephila clavipes]|nr:hypothetical protein TNCV_1031721 [Trichonephila clavipes]